MLTHSTLPDIHAALAGLGATLALVTLVWLVSLAKRNVSIVDVFWGLGFVVLAWLYRATAPDPTFRALLVSLLGTVWGLRLSGYILWRNWGRGEDYRYRDMRQRRGARFPVVSLWTVFWLQGVILWVVALPIFAAARAAGPPGLTLLDAAGVTLFAVGLWFETVGDLQLARFKADPANRGKVMDRGLWRFTRHPNYFGDAVVWWGFFAFAAATGAWWSAVGPALMTVLLLRVSGVSLLERGLAESKPGYRAYIERTSAFVPWFPKS